ncbi:hypothetical protein F3Y22_tig00112789pilonHSYRG00017 [Hibiscus syriacus]|uniref:DUF4378 domain-containing protein n=1 Tax=Hibiscus syriacus TaxID=106335 RepID=A0A6A2XAT6_HIBSY|nr:hypothetical protein F3Y22_tig00112789pilonHSYRG00017 [Hibiscus syriacus]
MKTITKTKKRFNKLVNLLFKQVGKRKLNQRAKVRTNSSNMPIPQSHQNHPSCTWGIFHVLKYHHWNRRFIKKRISTKKQDAGSEKPMDESVGASNRSADDSSKHKKAEAASSKVEGKKKAPSTGSKSVTSRLKALITDEVSKRKGQGTHHRSSTCPIPSKSDPDNQVDHLPNMEQSQGSSLRSNKNKGIWNGSGSEDQDARKSSEERIASYETDEECSVRNGSSKDEIDENTKTLLESVLFLEGDLDGKRKALQESKYLMDALDIIKMNQGFLLTVLQDPDSPFAHHFHKHLAMSAQMASTGSTSRENQSPDGPGKGKEADVCSNDGRSGASEPADHNLNQAKVRMADISSSDSSSHDPNRSEAARSRFKSLRDNLRSVIKEREKERHRIAMDAVLHKIPHQKGFSKDLTPDIVDHVKDPAKTKKLYSSSLSRRGSMRLERRTSFNASMDRYAQLFEHSFSKEAKDERITKTIQQRQEEPILSHSRSTKKYMRRILSSPELYSSAYSCDAFSFSSEVPTPTNVEYSPYERKYLESEALGYSSELDRFEKTDDEKENSMIISENISKREQDSKPEVIPLTKQEEPSSDEPTDSSAESSKVHETEIEPNQSFEQRNEELNFLPDLQQETKITLKVAGGGIIELEQLEALKKDLDIIDKPKFAYVKDVLELSGFSMSEALGAWHAENQPLDPMMFGEIKGCVRCDPNCSMEGEEVGYCNHPLLFDLTNEVLVEVYERSYSYYPRVLSPLCHVRPIPAGRHVLEQVWESITWYLSYKTGYDKPLDYVASRDLMGNDGWMSLQVDHESLALEVEELIFNDLLEEFSSSI